MILYRTVIAITTTIIITIIIIMINQVLIKPKIWNWQVLRKG